MNNRYLLQICIPLTLLVLSGCAKDDSSLSPKEETNPSVFDCDDSAHAMKGERMIGIDLLNGNENPSFGTDLIRAGELGMDFIALHTEWSGLEPSPGVFVDPFDAIALLGSVAEDNGMKLSLTIRPIDLTGKTVPSDLETTRFNDPLMIQRFRDLIDHVFTLVDPDVLHNLQIGNEIDAYDTSGEHPMFWSDYGIFLFECTQYIHSIAPELKVGFTATHHGLMEQSDLFTILDDAVDILGVTYYPLENDFTVSDPSVVEDDMQMLVDTYQENPIYLQEVGYQTSEICNSNEAKQAEFFCRFFQSWDEHRDHIHSVSILRMNDLSQSDAEESAGPYGLAVPTFIEYLRTLGLRSYAGDGHSKQAYLVLQGAMETRGW